MNYDREDYMRRQEAEHDMIRMRSPHAQRRQRGLVSCESVCRMIEQQEIAPIIKQRLIEEIIQLEGEK